MDLKEKNIISITSRMHKDTNKNGLKIKIQSVFVF